jgi:transcriptional regulator GlxA family with amidase domain
MSPSAKIKRYGFLLTPQFSQLAFASAIEPLRAANRFVPEPIFEWSVLGPNMDPMSAYNGVLTLPDRSIETCGRLDAVVVVGGIGTETYHDPRVFAWLRRQERQGASLIGISLGSFLLARCGLLDGYRCTLHWQYIAGFREAFPTVEVTEELYEVDRNRMTCSGGTAALDLMLTLIAMEHGRELAMNVAENFIHDRIRDRHDPQRMALRTRLNISHPKLLFVIQMMEENLEEPLARSVLAERAELSTRQLERLFRKYLKRTPTRYYLELRLEKARKLLNQTSLSVLDIAMASGFVSASHFSKCYREQFHRTPREERLAAP